MKTRGSARDLALWLQASLLRACAANFICGSLFLLFALVLVGCVPSGSSASDEEREPHYLEGRSLVSAMDYQGAIQAFHKALLVNPNSAAAHFELACLYDQKDPDPAAAIYHYQSYLRLRSKPQNADLVQKRMQACKQELARAVYLGPVTQTMQAELDKLLEENKRLRDDLEKWRAYALRLASQTNPPATVPAPTNIAASPAPASNAPTATLIAKSNVATPTPVATRAATAKRTHAVKAGDTPAGIARQYGINVDALMAANPGVQARRLKVGQVLNVP